MTSLAELRVPRGGLLLLLLSLAAAAVFFVSGEAYLRGEGDLRWGADSLDYLEYYRLYELDSWKNFLNPDQPLIQMGHNLLGPMVILALTRADARAVLALNIFLLLVSYIVIARTAPVRRLQFAFLLALNPLLFMSLLAVNKEILGLLASAFYAARLATRKRRWLLAAMPLALLVRWEHLVTILLFELAQSRLNPIARRRGMTILALLVAISLIYPFLHSQLGQLTTEIVEERQAATSFGLLGAANDVQRHFGYALVFVPKLLANWFGNLYRVAQVAFAPDRTDLADPYSTFGIIGHQIAMVAVVGGLLLRRRFRLSSDYIYFAVFYSLFYSTSMFIQYRYFYPIYPLLAIELSRRSPAAEALERRLPAGIAVCT
jgi:hypothetical protein